MTFEELYKTVVLECAELPVEEIADGLRQFSAVRKSEMATTARLLAAGRKLMPKEQWKEWAMTNSGLTRSECYHRAKAGDLLIAFQDKKVLYRKLLQLSGDKLLALAQLPLDAVEGFLTVTDVWSMKIADVRIEVKCELCRMEKRTLGQEPDCEHCPFHLIREGANVSGGFDDALEIIWNMDPEAFLSGVKDDTSATKCANNGVNLLAAALEYEKGKLRGNTGSVSTANLLQIKAALLDGIRDIEMLIAGELDKEENNDEISQDRTAALCGTNTENGSECRCGTRTENNTRCQCGNHTEDGPPCKCGHHTASEYGSHTRNSEQTCCHSEPKQDHRLCVSAGDSQSRNEGTAEVHSICPGTQENGTADSGSASRDESGAGPCGGVSDSSQLRSARQEPADLSELSELDPPDPRIPER